MILVDTSVWIHYLRAQEPGLDDDLKAGRVLSHPVIIGELALGHLRQRELILSSLLKLPQATIASDSEVLRFISRFALAGTGIGYSDAHVLAATLLTPRTRLWTRDKRLLAVAERLGAAHDKFP